MTRPQFNDAIHPYAPIRQAGSLLFVSGQLGVDSSGQFAGDIATETRQAFDNLEAQLKARGAHLADVVKVTVFLAEMSERAVFDPIYADRFAEPRPARSCVQAGALPFGARVELEAIAHLPLLTEKELPSHE